MVGPWLVRDSQVGAHERGAEFGYQLLHCVGVGAKTTVQLAIVAVELESEAEFVSGVMADPETLLWVPGFVTLTLLVMFQVKVAVPE